MNARELFGRKPVQVVESKPAKARELLERMSPAAPVEAPPRPDVQPARPMAPPRPTPRRHPNPYRRRISPGTEPGPMPRPKAPAPAAPRARSFESKAKTIIQNLR